MPEQPPTRRALDELGELYLTGSPVNTDRPASEQRSVPTPDAVLKPGQEPEQAPGQAAPPTPDPLLVGVTGAAFLADDPLAPDRPEDELVGPEPIRLAPKLPRESEQLSAAPPNDGGPRLRLERGDAGDAGDAGITATVADPLDAAIAGAIRRGQGVEGQGEGAQPDASATATVLTEAVVLGNVPGPSGPWLTQYAQLLADRLGPVALLHVEDERIDGELIEPADRPRRAGRAAPFVPTAGQGEDLIDRLDALLAPGPEQVRAVLVHTEASDRPAALERLLALDRWTLLCGADEAALTAGHRLIESLVEADPAAAAKRVGLMVVGSPAAKAKLAARRLAGATRPLLDEPARMVGCQPRMVPVSVSPLGRFGPTAHAWPRLVNWLALHASARPVEAEAEADASGGAEVAGLDVTEFAPDVEPEVEPNVAQQGQPLGGRGRGSVESAVEVEREVSGDRPVTADRAEPQAETAGAAPGAAGAERDDALEPGDEALDLASFLTAGGGELAGAVALEARCPDQPRTQLVLDQSGRLHLLRRHDSSRDARDAGDEREALHGALVDLLEARKWVARHMELLALTQRQCRFDASAEPALHLFTDRADLATGLIARLGDAVRLHLLTRVRVGEQSTWFCTPLSGPAHGAASGAASRGRSACL